jgi:hypothetical protein
MKTLREFVYMGKKSEENEPNELILVFILGAVRTG